MRRTACILLTGLLCLGLVACSDAGPEPDASSIAPSEMPADPFADVEVSPVPADDGLDVDLLNACSGVFLENCDEDYDFHGADILVSMDEGNVLYGFQFNKNQDGVQDACDRILADFGSVFGEMATVARDKNMGFRVMFVYVDGEEITSKDF